MSESKSKLKELLEGTEKKCQEYQKIARDCNGLKRQAQALLNSHAESLCQKLKQIAEQAYPPLLHQDYQGATVLTSQMGTVNVQILYHGWFTTQEAVSQSSALDKIDKEFKPFAAKQLGIPEKRINPVLIVRRTG